MTRLPSTLLALALTLSCTSKPGPERIGSGQPLADTEIETDTGTRGWLGDSGSNAQTSDSGIAAPGIGVPGTGTPSDSGPPDTGTPDTGALCAADTGSRYDSGTATTTTP